MSYVALRRMHSSETRLCQDQLLVGQLTGYDVGTRFYEIGSPAGLEDTRQYLATRRRRDHK